MNRRLAEAWGLPLVSLALAVGLWVYVVGQKEREWTYAVPVYVRVGSPDIAGWSMPEKVNVQLKGPQRLLDRITGEDLVVRMTLAENQAGQYTRGVQPSMLSGIPQGVEIVRIEPAEVRVEIRPLLEIRYRVAPQFRDGSDSAFRLGEILDVEPRYAELRGVREVLQGVTEVKTEPVDVAGPAGPKTVMMRLVEPEGARVFPTSVKVTYTVAASPETEAAPGARAPVTGVSR